MKKLSSVGAKILFMSAIIGCLLLANLFIGLKLDDRESLRNKAREDISKAAGGSFVINDIELVVPYVRNIIKYNSKGTAYTDKEYASETVRPESVTYDADIKTEIRPLGIYSAPVYTGTLKIEGQFNFPYKNNSEYTYSFAKAKFIIRLSDKSVIEIPAFELNGVSYPVEFEGLEEIYNSRLVEHVRWSILHTGFTCKEGINTFSTELKIRGASSFNLGVTGKQTKLSVKSDWNSPGFANYDYLPSTREITDSGFTADWFVPFGGENSSIIGFELKTPVDVYKMVGRAVTYGFLFIIVPFIVLFLFEIFMKLSLHPVNYLLCGAASIVFFLLLLSFSEHIPFTAAYLISSFASGIVISLYVGSISKKSKSGILMCDVFILMYGYLFFSLKSEDYALLIGSIFVFIIITVLMFFTRKVDWNNLAKVSLKKDDEKYLEKKIEN